jgi:glucose-6-phosphate 1-dehydrogenase
VFDAVAAATPLLPLLLQLLALVAMECPVSNHPDDIRDEKCRVLRCIPPVEEKDCLLGQYTAGGPAGCCCCCCYGECQLRWA